MASTDSDGADEVVTWHHGLMARWWANFNLDGPEIEYFGQFVRSGQPALDAACGTGRLLVPWVAAGLDVDGVDVSADMIAYCREAADRVGRSPALYVQPLHRLDIPRRYRCIVVCGGFGLGAARSRTSKRFAGFTPTLNRAVCWRWTTRSRSSTPSGGGRGDRLHG